MLKIVSVPHSVLTQKAELVTSFDEKLKKLVIEMEEALVACVDPQGVGLAAPQVGVSFALFIVKPTPESDTKVFINPKILEIQNLPESSTTGTKKKKDTALEGCLSIPRVWSPIKRSQSVLVEYQDITGEKHVERIEGFDAVIIQHEVDHLNGVLFTQRAVEQNATIYEEKNEELVPIKF